MMTDKHRQGRGALRVNARPSTDNLVADHARSQEIFGVSAPSMPGRHADAAVGIDAYDEANPPSFGLPDSWDAAWPDQVIVLDGPDGPTLDLVVTLAPFAMEGGAR